MEDFTYVAKYDPKADTQILDTVHGNIYVDPHSLDFVDTRQFQRLRRLKQLGATYLIYPGAVHTSFEHALGVYWLANEAVHQLRYKHGKELDIDLFDIQTVKLAGLFRDLGLGPFGRMLEYELLPRIHGHNSWNHENMSKQMIDFMVDDNYIDIDDEVVKRVKEMISSAGRDARTTSAREKCFLYDIVANGRNGLDVDMFDSIVRDSRACGLVCNFQSQRLLKTMRVIGDEICYPNDEWHTINNLLLARDSLHQIVYTHRKVKAIELMISDALYYANAKFKLESYVDEPDHYWKLCDSVVWYVENDTAQETKDSRDLFSRIRKRDLYKFCYEFAVPEDKVDHFKEFRVHDIICSQTSSNVTLKEEDVVICNVNIDPSRGQIERSIRYFEDYESGVKYQGLRPVCYQGRIIQLYTKKSSWHLVRKEAR